MCVGRYHSKCILIPSSYCDHWSYTFPFSFVRPFSFVSSLIKTCSKNLRRRRTELNAVKIFCFFIFFLNLFARRKIIIRFFCVVVVFGCFVVLVVHCRTNLCVCHEMTLYTIWRARRFVKHTLNTDKWLNCTNTIATVSAILCFRFKKRTVRSKTLKYSIVGTHTVFFHQIPRMQMNIARMNNNSHCISNDVLCVFALLQSVFCSLVRR